MYVNAEWNEKEEDKWKFPSKSKADLNGVVLTTSDPTLFDKDETTVVFELIMEVKN